MPPKTALNDVRVSDIKVLETSKIQKIEKDLKVSRINALKLFEIICHRISNLFIRIKSGSNAQESLLVN